MKTLAIAASSSKVSINRHLCDRLCEMLEAKGHRIEKLDYTLFDTLSHYNYDVEVSEGLPRHTRVLAEKIRDCHALLIALPEYNHAIPGTLKNGLDWLSRIKPSPLIGKFVLGASASPSPVGGWRGLQDLHMPMEALGAVVMPFVVSLGDVRDAAAIDRRLEEKEVSMRVAQAVRSFSETVAATARFGSLNATV